MSQRKKGKERRDGGPNTCAEWERERDFQATLIAPQKPPWILCSCSCSWPRSSPSSSAFLVFYLPLAARHWLLLLQAQLRGGQPFSYNLPSSRPRQEAGSLAGSQCRQTREHRNTYTPQTSARSRAHIVLGPALCAFAIGKLQWAAHNCRPASSPTQSPSSPGETRGVLKFTRSLPRGSLARREE